MRRFSGLLIAAAVLLVLLGGLYWSNHHPQSSPPAAISPAPAAVILNVNPDSLTSLTIHPKDAPQIVLDKSASGQWQIAAPQQAPADQDAVKHLASNFSPLNAETVVESSAPDLKPFGLDPPVLEIDMAGNNLADKKLLIGDSTPFSQSTYAMVEGDPRIFSIPGFVVSSLNPGVDSLKEKPAAKADAGAKAQQPASTSGK